jgi:hypothetical protein
MGDDPSTRNETAMTGNLGLDGGNAGDRDDQLTLGGGGA